MEQQPSPHLVPPLAPVGRLALTEEEMVAWGRSLGRAAQPPLLVTIRGELGAGKTTLARAICRGYGVEEEVTSPTFTLVHRYTAPRSPVYHIDLYRLRGPSDLQNIGWDDILAERALTIVEWPERAGEIIPPNHIPIDLQHLAEESDRRLLYAGGHIGEEKFGDHS